MGKKRLVPPDPHAGEKKPVCPITRQHWNEMAEPLVLTIAGRKVSGAVKEFSTGSFGWWCNAKIIVLVDGVPVRVQCNASFIVVGSKDTAPVKSSK